MNMAWTRRASSTSFRALRFTRSRKVIHEKNDLRLDRSADPVTHRRSAGSRAIRTIAAGADGLPVGRRKVLLRTHRQAAADERLPQGEQGEVIGRLPQGRGIARRVSASV